MELIILAILGGGAFFLSKWFSNKLDQNMTLIDGKDVTAMEVVTIEVHNTHGVDMYMVYRASDSQFILQTTDMNSITKLLFEKYPEKIIMFVTKHNLVGMLLPPNSEISTIKVTAEVK